MCIIAVRIKDIAKEAGVSVTTVSRVLNNEKYVKDEVRERVQMVIDEMGYTPSSIARSLVLKRTNIIGVIVPDITNSFSSTIISSIEECANQNNFNIMVCNIAESPEKELNYLNIIKEMRMDGVIITNEKITPNIKNALYSIDVPVVFVSVKPDELLFTSITVNNYQASYDATNYLINKGHKKIAFIGGDLRDITSGKERYKGYRKALEHNDLDVNEEYIKFGNYKMQDGYNYMEEILKCSILPTALFAASDDMAVGALNCILDNGLKVPEDISIIGFDNSSLTTVVRPTLTTISQPINEMGVLSVKTLIKQINNEETLLNQIIVKHKLIERQSCMTI